MTERRKAAEEMKARAANLVETLLTSKLRGKWRAMDFASKVAAFAAKEVERTKDSALLEAAGLACPFCADLSKWEPPICTNGIWQHIYKEKPEWSRHVCDDCEAGPIHERRALNQKGTP